jgi:hypothetical protein
MTKQPFESYFIATPGEGGIIGSVLGLGVHLQPQLDEHPQYISGVEMVILDKPSSLCSTISRKDFSVWLMGNVSTSKNFIFSFLQHSWVS